MENAMPATFSLMQSSTETFQASLDSSLSTLCPPETRSTIGVWQLAGTEVRKMPRVSMRQSAYEISGSSVFSITSRPDVGP